MMRLTAAAWLLSLSPLYAQSTDSVFVRTRDGAGTPRERLVFTGGTDVAEARLAAVNFNVGPAGSAAGLTGQLRFSELAANGANFVALRAADALAADAIWTLPAADGLSGQVLATNGAGGLSWVTTAGVGIDSLNGLAASAQSLAVGSAGLSPSWSSAGSVHTLNLPSAATLSVSGGLLSNADFSLFSNKVSSVGAAAPLSSSGGINPTISLSGLVGPANGGTGLNTSGTTGVAYISGGTWFTSVVLPVSFGGTGLASAVSNALLVGNGTGSLTQVTGPSGTVLTGTGGLPSFSTSATLTSVTTTGQLGHTFNPWGASPGQTGEARFRELAANGTNYVGLKAPDDAGATNTVYTLPAAYPATNGEVLSSTTSGVLSWSTVGGGITSLEGQTGAVQTFTDDTNVTITSAGNVHTLGWSGMLAPARGGTGLNTSATAAGAVLYTSAAGTWSTLSAGGAAQVLTMSGGVPTWATPSTDAPVGSAYVTVATDATLTTERALAAGSGIGLADGGANASLTVALGNLTANWSQAGAFDIVLNNASSELQILESVGATFVGAIDVGDLTADRTYTLPDATGTVALTSDIPGTYVSTITGGTGIDPDAATNGAVTVSADTTELTLTGLSAPGATSLSVTYGTAANTAVQGNQTATITAGGGLTGTISGDALGDGFSTTLDVGAGTGIAVAADNVGLAYSATLAADPALAAGQALFGTTGVIFEGASADIAEGLLTVADPTADRTWTLPDASGTVALTSDIPAGPFLAKNAADTSSAAAAGYLYTFSNTGTGAGDSGLSVSTTGTGTAYGLYASATGTGGANYGVYGTASGGANNWAVCGITDASGGVGVLGRNQSTGTGVQFGVAGQKVGDTVTGTGYGVYGDATGSGNVNYGVFGAAAGATTNWAGYFNGNVNVTGALTVGGGTAFTGHLSATAVLNFGTADPGASASLTVAVAGAAVGDTVTLGLPTGLANECVPFAYVSAADTVTIRWLSTITGGQDPDGAGGGTYRVDVWKH